MVHHCCVPLCASDSRKSQSISFHCFPPDNEKRMSVRKQWIVNVKRDPGKAINRETRVCSLHFVPEDYYPTAGVVLVKKLKPNSVPSIFSWTQQTTRFQQVKATATLEEMPSTSSIQGLVPSTPLEHTYSNSVPVVPFRSNKIGSSGGEDIGVETGGAVVSATNGECSSEEILPDSEVDKTNDVLCMCGHTASIVSVKTEGPNCGRKFYKCGNLNKCIFFRWVNGESPFLRPGVTNVDQSVTIKCRCDHPATNLEEVSDKSEGRAGESSIALQNKSDFNQTNDVLCTCGHPALLRTVKTQGQNCGRKFYMCGNMKKCIFFLWGDEKPARPAEKNSIDNTVTITCKCGQPAKLQAMKKDGPNKGRQFFHCPCPKGWRCDFFRWAGTGNNAPAQTPSASDNYVIMNSGKVSRAKTTDLKEFSDESPPQSPNRTPPSTLNYSEADDMNEIVCTCGYAARLLTVKSKGPNCGRQFYKCGNIHSCHFFLWADDELLALKLAVQMNGVNQDFTVACRCDNPAKLLTVEKDGPNSGREFFGCEESCGFFRWADLVNNAVPSTNHLFPITCITEEDPSDISGPEDSPNNSFLEDPGPHPEDSTYSPHSEDLTDSRDPLSEDVSSHSVPEKRLRTCGISLDLESPSGCSDPEESPKDSLLEDPCPHPEDPTDSRDPLSEDVSSHSVPEKRRRCGLCLDSAHNRKNCPRNRSRRK